MTAATALDKPLERVTGSLTKPERLEHRQRPVPELTIRREKLERDGLRSKLAQPQRGLECSNTCPGDQNTQRKLPPF
jgi:hypothetical protein